MSDYVIYFDYSLCEGEGFIDSYGCWFGKIKPYVVEVTNNE